MTRRQCEEILNTIFDKYDLGVDGFLAFEECLDFARHNMTYDEARRFMGCVCRRLGYPPVRVTCERDPDPDSQACVRLDATQADGLLVQGNREGLLYLAELFRAMALGEERWERYKLYPEDALTGDSCGLTVERFETAADVESVAYDEALTADEDRCRCESSPGGRAPAPREIVVDEIYALQFLDELPTQLGISRNKIYRVGPIEDIFSGESWKYNITTDPNRNFNFIVENDFGKRVTLGLSLDDDGINFFTRSDLSEVL